MSRPGPALSATRLAPLALALTALGLLGGDARAAYDELCDETISPALVVTTGGVLEVAGGVTRLTLTQDLDCTGFTGTVFTVGADNVIIEGNGFRVLAPDATRAIESINKKNVTVRNLTVAGWCNGTGIYIEGGAHGETDTGHVLENIQANGRSKGVHLKGTSKVQIRGLTTSSSSAAGLHLENVTQSMTAPLILRDLHLDKSLVGLLVSGFNGQDATCSGGVRACNYTFHAGAPAGILYDANAAVLSSVENSDTGVQFSGNVTNATVLGRSSGLQDVTFDGTTAGIDASAPTNANLTFQDLDVSTSFGTGTGLYVSGANINIANVVANQRDHGVRASSTTNLSVRRLSAQGATTRGLYLDIVTAPLFLEELSLVDCRFGLHIRSFAPVGAPFEIGPFVAGAGVIKSLDQSNTGIYLETVQNILVRDLVLTNPGVGVEVSTTNTTTNVGVTLRDLDVSSPSVGVGRGVSVGGANHVLDRVTARYRDTGVYAGAASNVLFRDLVATHNTGTYGGGIWFDNYTEAHLPPRFEIATRDRIDLRFNFNGIRFHWWQRVTPFVIGPSTDPAISPSRTGLLDVSESTRGLFLDRTRNLVIHDRTFSNAFGLYLQRDTNNILMERLDVSGVGGEGLYIAGDGMFAITARDVLADGRTFGVTAGGANSLVLQRVTARGCGTGVRIAGHTLATAPIPPLVEDLVLADNDTNLYVNVDYSAWPVGDYFRVTADPISDYPGATHGIYDVDLGVAETSLALNGSKRLSLENLTLDGVAHGLYLTNCEDLKVTGVDLSGPGRGSGLTSAISGSTTRGGKDLVLSDVLVSNRATGIALNGNRLTLDDVTLRNNTVALSITKHLGGVAGEVQVPPTLRNLHIDDNGTGLSLTSIEGAAGAPWVLGPYDLATDTGAIASLQGNSRPLALTSCRYVAVQGPATPAAPFAISGRSFGVDAQTSNSDLTFRNLAIDTLAGRGLALKGSGHLIEDVEIDTSQYGLDLEAVTDPVVRRVRSTRAFGAGFRLRSAVLNAGAVVQGLELVDNGVGLLIQTTSGTGTLALNPTALTELGGNRTDLTITTAANVTVDQAGLAVSATPITGGSSYSRALPPSNAICGTTLTADLILPDGAPDIDCRGTLSGAALTVGANGLTIDLKGRAILAPHVDTVIASSDRDDLTIKNADLSGTYSRGTGLDVVGGDRLIVTDVQANRRNQGASFRGLSGNPLGAVSVTGLTAQTTGTLSDIGVASGGGLSISAATSRPSLTGLVATRGVGAGLTLDSLDGASGGQPWVLGASQLVDLSGQAVSIDLTNGVKNVTFAGPIAGLDGLTAGIRSRTGPDSGLTYQDLELSAPYPGGTGLETTGSELSLSGLVATRRANGFYLRGGMDLALSDLTSTRNTVGLELHRFDAAQGATPPHPYPDLTNVDVRDNATALRLSRWTAPLTFDDAKADALDWTGSGKAIELSESSGVVFSGLDVRTPTGISADATNSYLQVLDTTFTGPGRGTALALAGPGLRVERVTADGFGSGVQLQYASGAEVRDLTARRNRGTGFQLSYLTLADTPPILERLTLTDNGTGLNLSAITLTSGWTLDNGPGSALALDVSGSGTGVQLAGSSNVTLSRFAGLSNKGTGIYLDGGSSCRLEDINVDGTGYGKGVYVRTGTGHRLTRVVSRWRDYGVDTFAPDGLIMEDVTSRFNATGLQLSYLSSGGAPDLGNTNLTDNGTGLLFWVWSLPLSVHPLDGLSVKGSRTGIAGTGGFVSNVTVEGFVGADRLDNPGAGISGPITNLTVRNVDASGSGRGVGIQVDRPGALIEDVTIRGRATGLSVSDGTTLTVRDLSVARVSGSALVISYLPAPPATRPVLSGLELWDSAVGFELSNASGSATEPLVFDGSTFVAGTLDGKPRAPLGGNLTNLQFKTNVRYATVRDLDLPGVTAGFDGGYASAWSNRYVTLDNVDATGDCRGTGVDLRGQDQRVVGSDLSRRGTGVRVQEGDRVRIEDSVIGSNVKGVRVDGDSLRIDTTALAPTTTGSVTVSAGIIGRFRVGQTLTIGTTQVLVGAIDTTNMVIAFSPTITPAPTVGTSVRSNDWNLPDTQRLTIIGSDLCANGRGSTTTYALDSGARPVTATNDYWRASSGPTHGSNTGGTGDFVTVATTAATLSPFQTVPTNKANHYCNQAPIPAAGPDLEACAGDTVDLNGASSYDPDCGPSAASMSTCAVSVASADTTKELFTYAWAQRTGLGVSLSNPNQALASFTAPTPPTGSNTTTLSFSLVVEDDVIPRTDTTSVLVRRRNLPPTAAAQAPTAVIEGATAVQLSSTGSQDAESLPLGYAWVQTAGPTVTLSNPSAASPTFDAPQVGADTTVTFALTVTDTVPPEHCGGAQTHTAEVSVLIRNQSTGCPPEDPDCEPCLGVADGTVLAADQPCESAVCGSPSGDLICEGGQLVSTCDPAYETVPDVTCDASVTVSYAIVYDAADLPRGTIRCTKDALDLVTCDELPGEPGVLRIYPDLWCTGVSP